MDKLIDAARRGRRPDIEALIEAVWGDAFRIALSVVRDRTLAEDAAQEACAILFRSIRTLRSREAFRAWFFRIVMREALRLERKAAPLYEICEDAGGLNGAEIRADVRDALFRLPQRQRAALVLHYYADLTSPQIAAILAIPDSSVRFHIMRAKRSLYKMLGGEFEHAV